MVETFNIEKIPQHASNMLKSMMDAGPFIREHKLWKGFLENRWVAIISILVAVIFSCWLISDLVLFFSDTVDIPLDASDLVSDDMGTAKEALKEAGKIGAVSSGTRYLLLIILEIVIFHFSVKTLTILRRHKRNPSFKEFIIAERRMIKLLFISFIKGAIANLVLSIILSIFGLSFFTPIIMFFVYSYFMGYAFIDNYNEQFEINMKDSLLKVRRHVGAATFLGVVITGLIYIPVIGPILAPIFGAVAATIYSHRYQVQKVQT